MNSVEFQMQPQMQNNELIEMISATIRCLQTGNLANIEIENSFSEGNLIKQKIKASYLTNVGKEQPAQEAIDAPMTIDELKGHEESKEEEPDAEPEEPEEYDTGSYEEYEYPCEDAEPEEPEEEPEIKEEEPEIKEEEPEEESEENVIVSFEEMERPATRAQYGCKYCGKDCKTKSAMQQHIKYHHEVVWYKCAYPTCGYEAKLKSQVAIHMGGAHRSQYYANANKCLACREFTSDKKNTLKYHVGMCARVTEMELCQSVKV